MSRAPRRLLLSDPRLALARRRLARTRQDLARVQKQATTVQQRFDSLFAHNPDAVYALDRDGRFVSVNQAFERLTGYSLAEAHGMMSMAIVTPDDRQCAGEHFARALGGEAQAYEIAVHRKSGRRLELHVTNVPIVVNGEVVGIYGVGRNVTLRRRLLDLTRPIIAMSSLDLQVTVILEALRDVLPYDSGGLYLIDREAQLLRPETLIGIRWVSDGLEHFEIPLEQGVMGSVARSGLAELCNDAHLDPRSVYPQGATVACEHLVVVPIAVGGQTVGVFYVARRCDPPFSVRDFEVVQLFIGHAAAAIEKTHLFEQTRASEERFHYQALHDPLTDLPNRVLLHDRLGNAIAAAERDSEPVSLLVLDLDRFKEVNDTLGHHAGDRLLQEVAARLRGSLRGSDTVARLGGDEFAVVLPGANASAAVVAADKIQRTLETGLVLEGCEVSLGASIGLATYPAHGADGDTLLRRADIAMYTAKRARGGVATYDPDQDCNSSERLSFVGALRRAISLEELTLHYQPQIDCSSGRLTGVEALVRWWHPERGLIAPDQFVPLAERSGLIRPLTRWVLGAAISQSATWRGLGQALDLSVNLSSHDLLDVRLPEFVAAQLKRWRLPAERLTLEITESALLEDPDRAMGVLAQLRRLGVRVSLDDFGTGYSSLSYLREWPVDEVKVDRSFVSTMIGAPRDRAIVQATVDLAHSLDLEVVAEGVEDQAILDVLKQMGCERAQGYHIARPMPPSQLAGWWQTHLSRPGAFRLAA